MLLSMGPGCLHDPSGGQNFIADLQIDVKNVGATQTNTYVIPSNGTLPGNTFGRTLLFGTAGLQAAGGPAPDFVIPNNFLFSAGGRIDFFGANSGAYAALPTAGTLSRSWTGGGNAVNSPANYLGQSGTVVAPDPASGSVLAAGTLAAIARRRRRPR
jgi:hypothetical protein